MTEAEFDKVMAVNIKSVFWGSNVFTAQVKKQGTGGAMVNIASVGAHRPRPGLVWYNASKAAIANVSIPGVSVPAGQSLVGTSSTYR